LKNKRNPISLIEDSFSSLKGYLDSDSAQKPVFTSALINELEQETKSVLSLCSTLNNDDNFIRTINSFVKPESDNGLLLKAEHFFISDLITAYRRNTGKQTDTSGFVLAYYYDALRNNHFADASAVTTLNKLACSDKFKQHLAHIQQSNILFPANDKQGKYFLLSALSINNDARLTAVTQHLNLFLNFTYTLSFNETNALYSYLGFDKKGVDVAGKF